MISKKVRAFSLAFCFLSLAFFVGLVVGHRGILADHGLSVFAAETLSSAQPEEVDFAPVWRAWHAIDSRYVDAYATSTQATTTTQQEREERVWSMIQGLAASLDDPYTVFLPPSEAEVFQENISGSFEGVGMEIALRDGILTVVSPLRGTPAARAGIESGDRILEIDGESTERISTDGAVQRIRGERGTEVVLTIIRDSLAEPVEISIIRDVIEIPTIDARELEDGVYLIELLNFSAKSPDLFRQALGEFIDSGNTKLIIDLRGNPGGFLEAAVDAASWFLPNGKIVVTEDYGGREETRIHRSRGYDVFNENLELVILIDTGSASASEILAGSLREHGVATLVGTNSFGKGSVQELVDITSDTSLKITVARWLLAGDVFITRDGIAPDIVVEIPEGEEYEEGRDYILEAALDFLQNE